MVFQELLQPDKTINTLVHLIGELKVSDDRLSALLNEIVRAYPIFQASVEERDLQFYFKINESLGSNEIFLKDNQIYKSNSDFYSNYSGFFLSVFDNKKVLFVKANFKGTQQLAIVMHHIIYDNDFLLSLLNKISQGISGISQAISSISDLNFAQDNWAINKALRLNHESLKSFWGSKKFISCKRMNDLFSLKAPKSFSMKINLEEVVTSTSHALSAILLSAINDELSKALNKEYINYLVTVKQKYINNRHASSGYMTNLVPIQISSIFNGNEDLYVETNKQLLEAYRHALLPKEEIFDSLDITDVDIDCLVNYLNIESLEKAELFLSMFIEKTRYPIAFTVFVSRDRQAIILAKTIWNDINLELVCSNISRSIGGKISDG